MTHHILATALLPHAHKTYAGRVQNAVLNALKPFTSKASGILYVPACHRQCLASKGANDHSIGFLYHTLHTRYGNKLTVLDDPIPHSIKSTNETIQKIDKLAASMGQGSSLVIIGTVDLSHHEFRDKPWPRIHKMRAEEQTILGLCQLNEKFFNPKFIDAPWSVKIVHHFAPAHGVVVAYDDSASVSSNVDPHDATQKTLESFVSYVGVVFARTKVPAADKLRDRLMAASVKNTIYHSFHRTGLTNQTEAPMWLVTDPAEGGVWAGLSCNGSVKCSLGRLNLPSGTSHKKELANSAGGCIGDANRRWGGLQSLENCSFKYEKLTRTKCVPWANRKDEYNPDTTGIIVNLKNGKTATYLPGVWRKHWPHKDLDYVLGQLAHKADPRGKGSFQDIDKQKLYKYTTTVFEIK